MTLRADAVRFAPRWARHSWDRCPFALMGWGIVDERPRGVGEVLDLVVWTKEGAPLRDMEPHPTAAVFEAVAVLRRELSRRQAAEMED